MRTIAATKNQHLVLIKRTEEYAVPVDGAKDDEQAIRIANSIFNPLQHKRNVNTDIVIVKRPGN